MKNNLFYLEVGISCRLLGSQSKMAPLYDRAGELQLGGGLPTDYFFHSVSANQPNNFNRPVQKSKERRCYQSLQRWVQAREADATKRK